MQRRLAHDQQIHGVRMQSMLSMLISAQNMDIPHPFEETLHVVCHPIDLF